MREWLARAVHAPRDPAWTADGYISEHWSPISPITGELDSFHWQVPVDSLEEKDSNRLLEKLNVLAADALIEAAPASETIEAGSSQTDTIKLETLKTSALETETAKPEPDEPDPAEEAEKSTRAATAKGDSRIELDGAKVDQADIDKAMARSKPVDETIDDKQSAKPATPDIQAKKQSQTATAPAAAARPPATGTDSKPLSKEASAKAAEKAKARPAKSDDLSGKLPGRLRTLPPPSPEIAPSSEPRIFISPRAPDDPGPE